MLLFSISDYLLPCPVKELTGLECPGCGFQRSFVALMRGDLADSLHLYPALIPFLFTWILLMLHLKFKFRSGAKWITYSFGVTAVIVFVNFMIKMIFTFHTHH